MDKETFDCEEYSSIPEMQYFSAERFKVNEALNFSLETYNAPEIAKQQESKNTSSAEGMSIDDAQEFMQSTTASSSTSSVSASSTSSASSASASSTATAASASTAATASVGATGAIITSVATICVATIVGSVAVPGLEFEEVVPPYVIEETVEVDFGTFEYDNYIVEYVESEDSSDVYANITFNFKGELKEGFSCVITEDESDQSVEVSSTFVEFNNLLNKDRTFTLTIYSEGKEIKSQTINFENYYLRGQNNDSHYVYKSTKNEDDTYNLYTSFDTSYDGEFATYINISSLMDDYVGATKYETTINGNISSVCNIDYEKFSAVFVTYFVKNNNYYFYNKSEEVLFGNGEIKWNANILDKKLTLNFENNLDGEIEAIVHYDDSTYESFIFTSNDIVNNSYEIELSKYTQKATVEIYANADIYNTDMDNKIVDIVGNLYYFVYSSIDVESVINSTIALTSCEIFDSSYNALYGGAGDVACVPVNLYFDGYLNPGDTYSVRVYSGVEEVLSMNDLFLDIDHITFTTLNADKEYTFKYYITVDGQESFVGETTKTLSKIEVTGLPDYYCISPNPGDAYVTFNEDGTSNVYLYMNVQETKYDMYYKAFLVDVTDSTKYYECNGSDNIAVFNNVPKGTYSTSVAVMLIDNGTAYSVVDYYIPSGAISTGTDQEGYYYGECGSASYDSSSQELSIRLDGKVMSDLRLVLTPEGEQPISITITQENMTIEDYYTNASISLAEYTLSNFTLTIIGEAIFQYGQGNTIKTQTTVSGNEYCAFKIEIQN